MTEMSNTVHDGVDHTVTRGDIEVTRHLEADGRGIVGTVELVSRAAEPRLVEVTQSIPDNLSVESTAFKPDAAPDFKDFSGGRITFRQTVEDDPERVVFGIMIAEPVDRLGFAPPTIEAADPIGATRSAPTADENSDPEMEIDSPPEESGDGDSAGAPDEDGDAHAAPESAIDPADLTETADGGVAPDAGAPDRQRRSVDLRLDRLSARIEEFATYAEALEQFIDEKGTAPEFVDRVESQVNDIDERVATTREDLDAEVADLRGELDEETSAVRTEVTAEIDELRGDLTETRAEVDALQADLTAVRTDVASMRQEIESLSAEVETLTGMRESLASALSGEPLADPVPAAGDDAGESSSTSEDASNDG